MATSGSFGGNAVTIGSKGGNYYFTNWQLAGQDTGGNYSTINWQTYMHYNQADAQLDNGNTGSNVGTLWSNGGRVYNYAGNFTTRDMGLASGTFTIGHNSDGTQSLSMSGSVAVYQVGTSSGSGAWSLPTIPRYAAIDGGINFNYVTDEWINFSWHADSTCDYATWWSATYDGGGHHDFATGGQGWWGIDLHNLASQHTYDFSVGVRRADSGLWTTLGPSYATTVSQNNFF